GYGLALACGTCGDRLYLNRAARPEHATYRCRRVRHSPGEPSASVIARNADVHVERDFLSRYGDTPLLQAVVVSSSAARDEAIATAQLGLDAARRAQD